MANDNVQQAYCCPACKENRTDFELLYRSTQRVRKDPRTGQIEAATAVAAEATGEQQPADVRCNYCWFEGPETLFTAGAKLYPPIS